MTDDQPGGAELLDAAARCLREEVLAEVPSAHRLNLLMVLSALGIAERELRSREASGGSRPGALRELVGETGREGEAAARILAGQIRAGEFDEGPRAADLHAGLSADVRRRLAIANPKYLRQAEQED